MATQKIALVVSAYVLSVAALLFLSPAGTSAQEDGTCRACHCQFNNIQLLRQLIESTIRDMLANDTSSTQLIESRARHVLVNDTESTQMIEERVINKLNTDSASTQTLETRITDTVESNLGKLPVQLCIKSSYIKLLFNFFSILDTKWYG